MSTAVLTSVTAGTSLIMTVIGRPAYNVHAAIARWSHGTICGTNLRPNLVSWFEEKSSFIFVYCELSNRRQWIDNIRDDCSDLG